MSGVSFGKQTVSERDRLEAAQENEAQIAPRQIQLSDHDFTPYEFISLFSSLHDDLGRHLWVNRAVIDVRSRVSERI
jgi:hypothetical protein